MKKCHGHRAHTTKDYEKQFYREIDQEDSFACGRRKTNKPHHTHYTTATTTHPDSICRPGGCDKLTQTTPSKCVHCGKEVVRRLCRRLRIEREQKSRLVGHERSRAGSCEHSDQSQKNVVTEPYKTPQLDKHIESDHYERKRCGRHSGYRTPDSQMTPEQLQVDADSNSSWSCAEEWARLWAKFSELRAAMGDGSSDPPTPHSFTNPATERQTSSFNSQRVRQGSHEDLPKEDCSVSRQSLTRSMQARVWGDQEHQLASLLGCPAKQCKHKHHCRKCTKAAEERWEQQHQHQQQQQHHHHHHHQHQHQHQQQQQQQQHHHHHHRHHQQQQEHEEEQQEQQEQQEQEEEEQQQQHHHHRHHHHHHHHQQHHQQQREQEQQQQHHHHYHHQHHQHHQQQQEQQQHHLHQEKEQFKRSKSPSSDPSCSGISAYDMSSLSDSDLIEPNEEMHYHRQSQTGAAQKEPHDDTSQDNTKYDDFIHTQTMTSSMVMAPIIQRVQRIYRTNLAKQIILIQQLNRIPGLVKETFCDQNRNIS